MCFHATYVVFLMSSVCIALEPIDLMKQRYLKLLAFLLLIPGIAAAQPTVTSGLTLEEYVNEILLGSGVTAFNITYTGDENQVGYLQNAEDTGLPLTEGLVLSSAYASNLSCETFEDVPFGSGVSGDQDLVDIANSVPGMIGQNFNVSSANDLCILEFDFVATGDTVKFNYIFGSDEYLEWVNSSFNDIFAFFLSGPGITGPYDSPAGFPDGAVNIAQVPNTDPPLPVTVSSVNDQLNDEYYIDNFNNDGVCQDGYTTKLEAIHEVICGETYHIKLAIADGTDTALESIVVLEAGSFTSNSVVQVDLSIDVGGPDADTMFEDCGEATLTFTRPIETVLEIEEMVIIEYQGEGINGVDYTLLPDTVVFAPGVESVSFTLDAFEDGLAEGIELVQFEILNLAACNGDGLTSYFEFYIADEPEPLVVEGYTVEMCVGAGVELEPIITGGYGNFVYDWSTGDDTPTIDVDPDVTTIYNVIVGDTCGMQPDDADIEVIVLDLPPLEVSIDNGDITLDCNGSEFITATATGGDGAYSGWTWENEEDNNLFGFGNSLFFGSWQDAEWIVVTVEDGCGFVAQDSVEVSFNIPELIIDLPEEMTVLCGENFDIDPNVSGGQAPYFYNWTEGFNWISGNEILNYSTEVDITLTFNASDGCGQNESAEIEIIVESPAVTVTLPEEFIGPCTEVFDIDAVIDGGSGGFEYTWTVNGEFYDTGASIDFQSDVDAVIGVDVVDQCGAADNTSTNIIIENPPLEIELGEDINASCVDNTAITVDILSGSGGYTYEWMVADTMFATSEDIVLQSFNTVPVVVNVQDACGGSNSDNLLYIIPDIPLDITVTADTSLCAGDGMSLSALADGGEGGFFYYWPELGEYGEDQYIVPYNTETYEVIATDICGESITADVNVEVQYLFSNFTASNNGDNAYEFFATPEPECEMCEYLWNFGDGSTSTLENPSHTFDGLDEYVTSLTVTNAIGCTDSTSILIINPIILYVPNAFTPNNDGINDVFLAYGSGILGFQMTIFNRWGEVVFESDDINTPWTGNHQSGGYYVPDGEYSYVVKVKGIDTDAYERKGHITVLR